MDNELMARAGEVRSRWEEIIPFLTGKSKDGKGWTCPLCGHGTNGDGLIPNPKGKPGALKCFGPCNFSGDIIQLYQDLGRQGGQEVSFREAVDNLGGFIGLTPAPREPRPAEPKKEDSSPIGQEAAPDSVLEHQKTVLDFTAYYADCRERITDQRAAKYLESRGISMKTAKEYGLGFDPEADTAGAGPGCRCPRLILPTSSSHYVARRVDGGETCKKLNPKGSSPALFNGKALGEPGPVFVVEGIFDALSIAEAGGRAVATCSTANIDKMLAMFKLKKPTALLLIALDSDKAGEAGSQRLAAGLDEMKIPYRVVRICGKHKDPNECLVKDKAFFLSAIEREIKLATTLKPDNVSLYIDLLMGADLEKFRDEVPTGYADLDAMIGGLHPGLYACAAISSLGKTTWCWQMAGQIAEAGYDVIFFSLEQSKLELVSKGIARQTFIADKENAVTSLEIRKGFLPKRVIIAAEQYKTKVEDRLNIVEGIFSCDISYVAGYVAGYIARTGKRPVVFIDYLQILQPTESPQQYRKQSTKETIDKAVTELKRMSRDLNIPVIAISSVNRSNYLCPIDYESLKESGLIEYSADCVWGLQLQCLNNKDFQDLGPSKIIKKRNMVREAKKATPRKLELVCLKNRYGISSYSCFFDYYPAFDYFDTCTDFDFEPEYEPMKAGRTL